MTKHRQPIPKGSADQNTAAEVFFAEVDALDGALGDLVKRYRRLARTRQLPAEVVQRLPLVEAARRLLRSH